MGAGFPVACLRTERPLDIGEPFHHQAPGGVGQFGGLQPVANRLSRIEVGEHAGEQPHHNRLGRFVGPFGPYLGHRPR